MLLLKIPTRKNFTLLETYDAGLTWDTIFSTQEPNILSLSIATNSSQQLFLLKHSNTYLASIYRAINTTTWDTIFEISGTINKIKFDGQHGYAFSSGYYVSESILSSLDNGNNWALIPVDSAFTMIDFRNNLGIKVDVNDDMQQSVDYGNSWTVTFQSGQEKLCLAIPSSDDIIICGTLADGALTLYQSIDGGFNWNAYNFKTLQALNCISFYNEEYAYATNGYDFVKITLL